MIRRGLDPLAAAVRSWIQAMAGCPVKGLGRDDATDRVRAPDRWSVRRWWLKPPSRAEWHPLAVRSHWTDQLQKVLKVLKSIVFL